MLLVQQGIQAPPGPAQERLPGWHQHRWPLTITLTLWGGYLLSLLPRIFSVGENGAWAGHINVWSDWPLHLAMTQFLAERDPGQWLATHPMYSDASMAYPFLTNLISSFLLRAGVNLDTAMTAPSLGYAVLLVLALYGLYTLLLGTPRRAAVATALFFLASGLGFTAFLIDASSQPIGPMLAFPPELYSRADQYQWYSGNFVVGMLMPQRAFLLGLTLALWSQLLLLHALIRRPDRARAQLIAAGLLAGLLPIAHAHSFLAIILISGTTCLALTLRWREWIWYALPATLLSVVLFFGVLGGHERLGGQMSWFPGFTAPGGLLSWLGMWGWMWGSLLPLALLGFTQLRARPRAARYWLLGGCLLFLFANLVKTQPIPWDNSKLFLWAYIGLSGLATLLLARLWRSPDRWLGRGLTAVLAVTLTATGMLELVRLQRTDKGRLQMTSADDIQLAERLRAESQPDAVFLTGTSHNHPIMIWAARPIVMGFRGWVGNFGLEQENRWQHMRKMYAGGSEALALLQQYRVSYVVIGPAERHEFKVNETWFRRFPLAAENRSLRVYRIPPIKPVPAAVSPAS